MKYKTGSPRLTCANCMATAKNSSKERGRFLRRHPSRCAEHRIKAENQAEDMKVLAEGIRSVEE